MASFLVVEKTGTHFSFMLLGRQQIGRTLSRRALIRLGKLGGDPEKICRVTDPSANGERLVKVADYTMPVAAGGVRLTEPGSVAVIHTCDEPVVILSDPDTGHLVLCKAGRAAVALEKRDCALCFPPSILENSIRLLVGNGSPEYLFAHIVIEGACRNFLRQERVNDVREIILAELTYLGIPRQQVTRGGYCTFTNLGLASGRMGHKQINTVAVIHH